MVRERAVELFPRVRTVAKVWVTEAVLVEIGNALSALDRRAAVQFIELCYRTDNIHVVSVDTLLLDRALQLYDSRPDKTWGLPLSAEKVYLALQDRER